MVIIDRSFLHYGLFNKEIKLFSFVFFSSAIEEKYLNTKRQSIISGSFLTLSDSKPNSKSGKLETTDYESLQKSNSAVSNFTKPMVNKNLNMKKWLPDLQIKPHVIRLDLELSFSKAPLIINS